MFQFQAAVLCIGLASPQKTGLSVQLAQKKYLAKSTWLPFWCWQLLARYFYFVIYVVVPWHTCWVIAGRRGRRPRMKVLWQDIGGPGGRKPNTPSEGGGCSGVTPRWHGPTKPTGREPRTGPRLNCCCYFFLQMTCNFLGYCHSSSWSYLQLRHDCVLHSQMTDLTAIPEPLLLAMLPVLTRLCFCVAGSKLFRAEPSESRAPGI